jgi:hypothetical protein
VKFQVTEPLSEIELCHCDRCKRAFGAAFAATLYARASGFRWTAGAESVRSYDAPIVDSPPAYRHCFCERCGAPLPLLWEGVPLVEIPVACLDGDVAARPSYQMFRSQRAEWSVPSAKIPWHDGPVPLGQKVLQSLL